MNKNTILDTIEVILSELEKHGIDPGNTEDIKKFLGGLPDSSKSVWLATDESTTAVYMYTGRPRRGKSDDPDEISENWYPSDEDSDEYMEVIPEILGMESSSSEPQEYKVYVKKIKK